MVAAIEPAVANLFRRHPYVVQPVAARLLYPGDDEAAQAKRAKALFRTLGARQGLVESQKFRAGYHVYRLSPAARKQLGLAPERDWASAATIRQRLALLFFCAGGRRERVLLTPAELASANYAIIRLLFYVAYTVARSDYYPRGQKNGVVFICDEVQDVVSPTVLRLLDKARSRRLGVIFAHQNRAQLQHISEDAASLFFNGFGTHIHFTPANQPDAEEFLTAESYFHKHTVHSHSKTTSVSYGYAGDSPTHSKAYSESTGSSQQFVERPRFDMNRLLRITAEKNRFLFRVWQQHPRFDEVGRYLVCDRIHHIEPDVYQRRAETPPPKEPFAEGMIVNPLSQPPSQDSPPPGSERPGGRSQSRTMKLHSELSRALFGSGGRAEQFLRRVSRPDVPRPPPS